MAKIQRKQRGSSVGVSEFKTHCLQFLEETRQKGREWTITKKGEPVAKVMPIRQSQGSARGRLKGLMTFQGDIVHWSSTDDWEVLR